MNRAEEMLDILSKIPSTHVPISEINGKVYHYMCKEDIVQALLSSEKEWVTREIEAYAHRTIPELNDKWRKRLEEMQRINNAVLADKCDELSKLGKQLEARLKPLREAMEFKKNNPNKVGTYLMMIDEAIKQSLGV